MNFETYAKLWPHQLDLLSGPLLEEDDDDIINVSSLSQLQNEMSINENLSDDFVPINVGDITNENSENSHKNDNDIFTKKKKFHSLNKGGLGMLVYIGSKGESAKESDEEVDVETIDDEMEITSINKRHSLYHPCESQTIVIDALQEKSKDLSKLSEEIKTAEQNVALTFNLGSCGEPDVAANGTTVLQANDVDSLLEKFEASEGITSQEIKSSCSPDRRLVSSSSLDSTFSQISSIESPSSLKVNDVHIQNSDIYSKSGKINSSPDVKDISPHIIQKIKMASCVKKGSILIIPPEHKRKPRSKSSHPNSSETRKMNRSSVSMNLVAASTSGLKNSIVASNNVSLMLDHDYCSTSVSDSTKKHDIKSSRNNTSNILVETNSICSEACQESYNSLTSAAMETNFVPDAQVEIEIIDSVASVESYAASIKDYSHVSEQNNSVLKVANLTKPVLDMNKNIIDRQDEILESVKKGEVLLQTTSKSATKPSLSKLPSKPPSKQCSENKHATFSHLSQVNRRNVIQDVHHSPNSNISTPCNRSPVWGKRLLEGFCNSRSPSPSKRFCNKYGSLSHSPSWSPKGSSQNEDDVWTSPRAAFVDNNGRNFWKSEKQKQIEERRVVYVGKIMEGTTVGALRDRFVNFGPIQDISVHFRDSGDNYGFVTFFDRNDAYEVVERGNCDPKLRNFDLCFGGRRQFCKTRYSDLDFSNEDRMNWSSEKNDFDTLLQKAKASAQIMRRQSVVGQ